MIMTSPGLFLAFVEFKGRLFSYLDNFMALNCIGEGMLKDRKDGGDQCHLKSGLCQIEALCFQLCLSYFSNDWSIAATFASCGI